MVSSSKTVLNTSQWRAFQASKLAEREAASIPTVKSTAIALLLGATPVVDQESVPPSTPSSCISFSTRS